MYEFMTPMPHQATVSSIVLIVDDEESGRDALEATLFDQHYTLVFATNGHDALAKAAQFVPDVILLDVMMPDMDGFEVCQELRANPTLADIPVVMVTALDDRKSRLRGFEVGADDFVSKPIDPWEIRARVRTITTLNRMRRQHLQELQSERDNTRAILESLQETVVVTTPDGVIQHANPASLSLTGYTRTELVGQNWRIWQTPEHPDDFYATIETFVRSTGQTWRGQVRHRRKNGSIYDAMLIVAPLFDPHHQGHIMGLVSSQMDITPLKDAQRIKDQFISNISHEFSTPLSVIMLHAENLNSLYPRLSDSKRQKLASDIQKHVELLDQMVNGVLNIARLDSRTPTTHKELVDMVELVRTEVEQQRPLAEKKHQRLTINCGHSALIVQGQADELRIILRNLLNNAIKYTPPNGHVCCDCCTWTAPADDLTWPGLTDLPAGQWVACRVTDTGPGIAPTHLPHVFERFYRIQAESTVRGTGLGLAIVHDIARLYNGHVAVASVVGAGSIFAVYLPAEQSREL